MRRSITALVVLLGLAGAGLAVAPGASAATTCLVVDTNSNQSYTGLQAAVSAAAAGDTLFVKGTCTGTTEIGKSLTVSGHSASGTKTATLNGDSLGSVLTIDSGVTVTLNTLVIIGGTGTSFPDFGQTLGGGIFNNGTLTLNSSTVTGNTVTASDANPVVGGGGIANNGTLTLNSSTITSNTATSSQVISGDAIGGGIANGGTLTANGSTTVTGNNATASQQPTAEGVAGGGGIANGTSSGETVTLNDTSSVTDNTAVGTTGEGGGILNSLKTGASVTMTGHATINGNTAETEGGGIWLDGNNSVTLTGSATITRNTAEGGQNSGGGIWNDCGTLVPSAAPALAAFVFSNTPDDIFNIPACA